MRTRLSIGITAVLAIGYGGCTLMQNLNPENRLADIVYRVNDEARWGRIDLAAMSCTNAYRLPFVSSHAQWGHDVQIGDAEVTNLALGTGGEAQDAQSLVTYSWIDNAHMELHTTTVRQSWTGDGDGFRLTAETVISGEEGLFEEVEGGPTTLEDVTAEDTLIGTAGGDLSVVTPEAGAEVHSAPRRRDSQGMLVH
jgi:hypothetical protein